MLLFIVVWLRGLVLIIGDLVCWLLFKLWFDVGLYLFVYLGFMFGCLCFDLLCVVKLCAVVVLGYGICGIIFGFRWF